MKFKAEIRIMTQDEILDPQGKVVTQSLHNLGMKEVENVRIGKHITMYLEAGSLDSANETVENACKKLLANLIMERYEFRLNEIKAANA